MKKEKVISLLVLYNPTLGVLKSNIDSIIGQVDLLWISDNTPGGAQGIQTIIDSYHDKIKYALMDGNVGIAKAQNVGIQYAIEHDYDFIYFLDQDSISPENVVYGLLSEFKRLVSEGYKVGGVGPQPCNRETGKAYLATIKKGHPVRDGVKEVTELINSASLISASLFDDIGMMDESLFIDGVDHELCWRASYLAQYRFFMVTSILLDHKVGEGDRHLMGITILIATPFRTYFQFRNYFYLIKRSYVPVYWKVSNGVKFVVKYFYYPVFCKPRLQYLKNIHKGIFAGLFSS